MITIVVPFTTSISAGTEIDLSPYFTGEIRRIAKAILFTGSDATSPASATELTVVTGTPSSGQIQLVSSTSIKLGDAVDTKNILVLVVELWGEYVKA